MPPISQLLLGMAAAVAAIVFAMLTVLVFGWSAGGLSMARRSLRWRSVHGTITRSEVRSNKRANGLPGHRYVVEYEFNARGVSFSGSTVSGGWFPYGTYAWAERRSANFPMGASVLVYHDPDDPDIAVLEPGLNLEALYQVLVVLLLVGVTLGFALVAVWQFWMGARG